MTFHGIPTPFPTWGGAAIAKSPLVIMGLCDFAFVGHPRLRSVLVGSRGCIFHLSMEAALAENLPHRSREHEFSAGLVYD